MAAVRGGHDDEVDLVRPGPDLVGAREHLDAGVQAPRALGPARVARDDEGDAQARRRGDLGGVQGLTGHPEAEDGDAQRAAHGASLRSASARVQATVDPDG